MCDFGNVFDSILLYLIKKKSKIMEIKGKVHCFFEQSGTFKNEFKNLEYQLKTMIYKITLVRQTML